MQTKVVVNINYSFFVLFCDDFPSSFQLNELAERLHDCESENKNLIFQITCFPYLTNIK